MIDGLYNKIKSLVAIVLVLYSFSAISQTAPGGIATRLVMWYKADAGVTEAGTVSSWLDQTNGYNASQNIAARRPTYNNTGTATLNFNPTLSFDEGDNLKTAGNLPGATTGLNTYIVHLPTIVNKEIWNWASNANGYRNWYDVAGFRVSTDPYGNVNSTDLYTSSPVISSVNWDNTGAGDYDIRTNGKLSIPASNNQTQTNINNGSSYFSVGGYNGGREYAGRIAEVIAYDAKASANDLLQIESYLAIKYGLTLDQTIPKNYLASDGSTIWDVAINTGYNNNVVGVCKDDGSALYQKQSQSSNGGFQPIISVGGVSTNNANNTGVISNMDFLIAGSDNGTTEFTTAFTTNSLNNRSNRVWKVQETGSLGMVTIAIKKIQFPLSLANPTLLVSNDAVFTATDNQLKMELETIGGDLYYTVEIDLANAQYFTFSGFIPVAQSGCDLAAVRAAFDDDGNYDEITVANQPCSIYFIDNRSLDADQAEAYAQVLGGHMVVFTDSTENADVVTGVYAVHSGNIWIGYKRIADGSLWWETTDGSIEPFEACPYTNPCPESSFFQNWNGGEPNDSGSGEACVQIYGDGYWNDLKCSNSSKSVIEVNLCPVITTPPKRDTVCNGLELELSTDVAFGSWDFTYEWTSVPVGFTSAISTPTITLTETITYNVQVTDRYGCKSNIAETVVESRNAVGSLSPGVVACDVAALTDVVFTAIGGESPYVFNYKLNNTPLSYTTGVGVNSFTIIPAANDSVILISIQESSSAACFGLTPDTAAMVINPKPTATIVGAIETCQGAPSPIITFTGTLGTGPFVFSYNINGGATTYTLESNPGVATATLSVSTNTIDTYTYNLVYTEDAFCGDIQNENVEVVVKPPLSGTVTSSVPKICKSDTTAWLFVGGSGVGPYAFTYTIDSVKAGTQSTGTTSLTSLPSPNTYADTLVITLISVSDASGLVCPLSATSFDSLDIEPIPTSIISAALNDVCENVGGFQEVIFDASANNDISTPVTFNYYTRLDGGVKITSSTTSEPGELLDTITFNIPSTPGQTIFYNLSVSSASCAGGEGGGSDTITVNPLPTATISAVSLLNICETDIATFRLAAADGTAPYTFEYIINAPTSIDTITKTTTIGTSLDIDLDTIPGIYEFKLITVTDSFGCSPVPINNSITFTVDAMPTVSMIDSLATICQDSTTIEIAANCQNGMIAWDVINGPGSIIANGSTGNPTFEGLLGSIGESILEIKVTSINACASATVVATATVTTVALPTATSIGFDTICENSSHIVSGASVTNGDPSWSWTSGGMLSVSADSPLTPTYTAVAADTSLSVILTLTSTSNNVCGFDSKDIATYTITVDRLPIAIAGNPDTICENAMIVISGAGARNGTVYWEKLISTDPGTVNTNNTTLSPTFNGGGSETASETTLLMTVASDNYCEGMIDSATTIIKTDPLPEAKLTVNYANICENSSTTAITGSAENGTVEWSDYSGTGGSLTDNLLENSPTFTAYGQETATITTILLTAKSDNFCGAATHTLTATIKTDPLPKASVSTNSVTICENTSTSVITGAATYGTIVWSQVSGPGSITGSQTSNSPKYTAGGAGSSGIALLKLTVNSNNACLGEMDEATATVVSDPLPLAVVSADSLVICENGLTAIAGTPTNGTGTWKLLSGNGTLTGGADVATYEAKSTGVASLKYTVISNNTCESEKVSKMSIITMESLPKAKIITKKDSTCSNVSFDMKGEVSYGTAIWTSNGIGELKDAETLVPNYTPNESEEFNTISILLTANSNNACIGESATEALNVYVLTLPTAYIIPGLDQCEAGDEPSVILVGNGTVKPYSFKYTVGPDTLSSLPPSALAKQLILRVPTYKAEEYFYSLLGVKDGNGCEVEITANNFDTVQIYRKPYADFVLQDKIVSLYESTIYIEESSIDASVWEWDFGDNTSFGAQHPDEHTYGDSGSFNITLNVMNPSGCKDSTTQVITIEMPTSIYIPSSFTPNNDGVNDIFLPKGNGIIEYSMTIYNRWGEEVFHSADLNEGWRGLDADGTPDQLDAYVYLIVIKDVKFHEYVYRGSINLIW